MWLIEVVLWSSPNDCTVRSDGQGSVWKQLLTIQVEARDNLSCKLPLSKTIVN